MATLRIYRGDQFVAPFELGEGRTRVGRGTENQLVLEDKDKQVSRSHAEIWFDRGHYVIADLNSQNGVWIGERQIKTEEVLPVDVPVTIGPYRLILEGSQPTVLKDMIDGAEMTREREAFVEPTQIAGSASMPPPQPPAAARSQPKMPAPKVPPAKVQPAKVPPANVRTGTSGTLIGIAALVAVIAIGAVAVTIMMRNRGGAQSPPISDQTPPATPAPAPPTTSVLPGPTAEERFQEQFNKAAAAIAANDKAGAEAANKEALTILADDSRALEQQKAIAAMSAPGQPSGTPTPEGTPPGTLTPKPAAPQVAEFLRVQAKPGESEKDRLTRERGAKSQFDEGKRALAEQRWDNAIAAFQAALKISERTDYGTTANETTTLLRQAQKGRLAADAAQRSARAQRVMDEAHSIGESNVLLAVQRVREAMALDPQVENATELLNILIEHGRVQGENALKLARNYEVAGRKDEAIREYERAEKLLELGPADNKNLESARQRLAQLKK